MSQGQTSVSQESPLPFGGQIDNSSQEPKLRSMCNKSGGSFNAGLAVKSVVGSTTVPGGAGGSSQVDEFTSLAAVGDPIAGITVLDMQTDPDNIAGTYSYHEGVTIPVLEDGDIWVLQDFALASPADPVYVRVTAGTGTVNLPGAFGNSADGANCRLVSGARWKNIGTGVAGSVALLEFDALTDAATR